MSQLHFTTGTYKNKVTYFAEIILPVPLSKTFTYRVPEQLEKDLDIGYRVVVPFGKNKILTGIIAGMHQLPPQDHEARYIIDSLDNTPTLNPIQMTFLQWMSSYYMCTLGEAINCALPSGLKVTSQSFIQLNPSMLEENKLTSEEAMIIDVLKHNQSFRVEDLEHIVPKSKINQLIKQLILKDVILLYEHIREKFSPKIEIRIRLINQLEDNKKLDLLYEKLASKEKQSELLIGYLEHLDIDNLPEENRMGIPKKILLKSGLSASSLKTLIKKNVFEEFEKVISRFEYSDKTTSLPTLSDKQKSAKQKIDQLFESKETLLLFGVTGSGKTEIFIHLIQEAIISGCQALYLLPEIALTTQIVVRLRKVFGAKMGVFHSRYSDNERVEVWKGIEDGTYSLVVGVRSSIFLPFDNLGLIIIDEEHEPSYKQHNPAPRYHARDSALMLAKLHHAKVVLGSATPSAESFHNTEINKFGLITLSERYGGVSMPTYQTVDLRKATKTKKLNGNFSEEILEAIKATIDLKNQVIIFQNRRGYAPYLSCDNCGWIPHCDHCAVSLTYHQYKNELQCHYCSFRSPVPHTCDVCNGSSIRSRSYGTEKLEEDLSLLFPNANIARMDLDTTRGKYAYDHIIEEFARGGTDILIGTQMVAKGLDFDKVGLVGVLDIDRMIHFPDFRASERAYQLVTQVAGRAGRRHDNGHVIIQTFNPGHSVIMQLLEQDYYRFYKGEINERKTFHYPPFVRMIRIIIKHKDQKVCQATGLEYVRLLKIKLSKHKVLGPVQPAISRIRNKYIYEIFVKINVVYGMEDAKSDIRQCVDDLDQNDKFKAVSFIFDVDPI